MIKHGICVRVGVYNFTLGKIYELSECPEYGSEFVIVTEDCGDVSEAFLDRFELIPEEVINSPLYQAIYGLTNED